MPGAMDNGVALTPEDIKLRAAIWSHLCKLRELYAELGECSLGKVASQRLEESVQAAEEAININRRFADCG